MVATWKEVRESLRQLRSRRYDVVFDFQGLLKSGVFTRLARSPRRIGFGPSHLRESRSAVRTGERLQPPEGRTHVIDQYLYLLKAVGIDSPDRSSPIEVEEELDDRARRILESMGLAGHVAMSPGMAHEAVEPAAVRETGP